MAPLEQVFALEIRFQRRLSTEAPPGIDAVALHTSDALQTRYEPLLRSSGRLIDQDFIRMTDLFTLAGDVCAARDSLTILLGLQAGRD